MGKVVEQGVAEVIKIETCYPKIPSRNVELQVAQIQITMKAIQDSLPPVDETGYHEGKLKKVKKEGGKKGSELAGAADMGGIEYFTTTAETPEGDARLLEIVNQEMNAEIDPLEEESKGGSARVAKCLLSASDKQLAILTYVPADKLDKVTADGWMTELLKTWDGAGEIVLSSSLKTVAVIKADEGLFPIKMREQAIGASCNFLKSLGLFPDNDSDSDEMVL